MHGTAASQQSIDCQERHCIEALGGRRWATDGDMEEAARRNLELLDALLAQDDAACMGMPSGQRIQMAADEAH